MKIYNNIFQHLRYFSDGAFVIISLEIKQRGNQKMRINEDAELEEYYDTNQSDSAYRIKDNRSALLTSNPHINGHSFIERAVVSQDVIALFVPKWVQSAR